MTECIRSNFSKCWIKDLTDFKPPVERIKNNVIPLVAIVRTDFNEFKACVIIVIKLIGEFDMLLIAL